MGEWDVIEILTFGLGNDLQEWSMPGKARIDAPGALQYIVIRGIERKLVFEDSDVVCPYFDYIPLSPKDDARFVDVFCFGSCQSMPTQ